MEKKIRTSLMLALFLGFLVIVYQLCAMQGGVPPAVGQLVEPMVDLYSQKDPYGGKGANQPSDAFTPNEEVVLYTYVTGNGDPLANQLTAVEVRDASGARVVMRNIMTNEEGIAPMSFRIPSADEAGVFGAWIAVATVEINEELIDDMLSFNVGWIIDIGAIRTVDGDLQLHTVFTEDMDVIVELLLRNIALHSNRVTLTITAYDNDSQLFDSITLIDLEIHPGVMYSYYPLELPQNISNVNVTVAADAFTALPQLGGEEYCPTRSTTFTINTFPDPPASTHDVAVIHVMPSAQEAYDDQTVTIQVVVMNNGTENESFDLGVYSGDILIGIQTDINLAPNTTSTHAFPWNLSNLQEGTYQISALASIVPEEHEILNNQYTNASLTLMARSAGTPTPEGNALPRHLFSIGLIVTPAIVLNGAVVVLYRRKGRKPGSLDSFIKRFLVNLNIVGGVMSEEIFLELFKRTEADTNLKMDLVTIYHTLRDYGFVAKVSSVSRAGWMMTLKGLKFADLPIESCCYSARVLST